MSEMKESSAKLLESYQVRKTAVQKFVFFKWLHGHLKGYGYEIRNDQYSEKGNNFIVGDVEKASVIISAHYDTAPNSIFPMFMGFSNWFSFIISQFISIIPIFVIPLIYFILNADKSGGMITFDPTPVIFFYLVYSFQLMFGFANRHTANDNTSGVATLISILEELPEKDRSKLCVVFFDQEELGLIGSIRFHQRYKTQLAGKPIINFDCVSDGDTLTFVTKKAFRESEFSGKLEKAAEKAVQGSKKKLRFCNASTNIYMSDQLHFTSRVGVVAAKKLPLFGYYINRIHSSLDKKFDSENIKILTKTVVSFAESI